MKKYCIRVRPEKREIINFNDVISSIIELGATDIDVREDGYSAWFSGDSTLFWTINEKFLSDCRVEPNLYNNDIVRMMRRSKNG